ncbi:SAF domain-containing protein [Archangium gephyra]|uniref:SAF domain-containing protein n=1 Tax=Archangium gephyra TaxID=48 RepID=UPI0035D48B43
MSAPRKPLHKGLLAGGLVVGLGIGLVAGMAGAWVLSFSLIEKAKQEVRAGWTFVPVVVANRDVAPGEVLKLNELAQRSIPEQLATSSLVRPDSSAYVVGQALTVPVQQGEPLRWAFFATATEELKPEETRLAEECQRAFDRVPNRPMPDQSAAKIRERILGGGAP